MVCPNITDFSKTSFSVYKLRKLISNFLQGHFPFLKQGLMLRSALILRDKWIHSLDNDNWLRQLKNASPGI